MAFFSESRFPQELRDQIWEFAVKASPPRIIELTGEHKDTIRAPSGDVVFVEYGFISNTPIPATLHACSRSREIAKKRWTLTFDSEYTIVDGNTRSPSHLGLLPRTWFDFESDTLLFMEHASKHACNINMSEFVYKIGLPTRERIRHIILNFEADDEELDTPDLSWEEGACLSFEGVFPELQTLSLAFRKSDDLPRYDLSDAVPLLELDKGTVFEEGVVSLFKSSFDKERGENTVVVRMVWMLFK